MPHLPLRALALLLTTAASGATELTRHEFESPQMGTIFRIVLYAEDPSDAKEAADAAFALAAEFNQKFSDYDADSELMRLVENREATASPELFEILTKAQEIARLTGGAFDITTGAHTRNWRRARLTGELPSAEAIAGAKAASGWKNLDLDPATRRVKLHAEGMFLDLGGIAKGYTADAMLALLRKRGFPMASVAAGGDIATGDPPPGKEHWTVRIEPGARSVELANQAISTSGDTEQRITIGGRTYSHIVDPNTGLGLTASQPVSVVAQTATESDAFATAFSVMEKAAADRISEKRSIKIHRPASRGKPGRHSKRKSPLPGS